MKYAACSRGIALMLGLLTAGLALAAKTPDVRNTLHNLSAAGSGTLKATSESQICAFCHTPHAATPGAVPLWNRKLSGATYSVYTSNSLDANQVQGALDQPGGSSKLCLSCHDGTLAIGSVNVLNGQGSDTTQGTVTIPMTGTGPGGTMATGSGVNTGFTRNLGIDLTNDHPISVTYNSLLAARDGELRPVDGSQKWPPGTGETIGIRSSGYRPRAPLEPTGASGAGQVQCATCHDPHLRETDASKGNQKFLRLNRFQEATPGNTYDPTNDIVCLACHDKNLGQGVWAYSAHANPAVANETYTPAAATQRQFPNALPVWKAACLNCHDTHTVPGSRRLLREGTDGAGTPKSGGASAIEETCYQCHTVSGTGALNASAEVPDIRTDFTTPTTNRRMPITNVEQGATEPHDIGGNFSDSVDCTTATNKCGADFIESRAKLGVGNLSNRHAECTDCHNPHRVVKFRNFYGTGGVLSGTPDAAGTHTHTDTASTIHSNIASGVLRGTFGVEPIYGSASFQNLPTSYMVKRGDPGSSVDTSVGATYVTREYQICLKCHSDYGYSDNNLYPTGSRPNLGYTGGTPAGLANQNQSQYTNQAKEFQAPVGHKGEVTTADSGAAAAFSTNNHRSWHPAIGDTGRTGSIRGNGTDISTNWRLPWRNAVGTQTMYCTDCHGSTVTSNTSVIPNGVEPDGSPWGPHGSSNNFILKGTWNTSSGTGQATTICFKCHDQNIYTGNTATRTGFWIGASSSRAANNDGHKVHRDKLPGNQLRCNWCHVAVPHGWKNKGLLVNKNDVGPEAGQTAGTVVANAAYNQAPYYRNAMLKIKNFRPSGNWTIDSCGAIGQDSRTWMQTTCNSPP